MTEFVYKLHPQHSHVFAGPLVFPPPFIPAVITATQEWLATASEKEGALVLISNKGPTGLPFAEVLVFYNGDEEEGRKRFDKLISLGPVMDRTGMIPYETLNTLQNEMIPYGANYYFSGTLRGEMPMTEQAAQDIFNQIMQLASTSGPCASISSPTITVMGEFLRLKKICSVAPDATAYRMRVTSSSIPMMINWEGDSAEASGDAQGRLRRMMRFVDDTVKHTFPRGKEQNDTGYGNYGASSFLALES